jgi:hypothetical protein
LKKAKDKLLIDQFSKVCTGCIRIYSVCKWINKWIIY